MNRYFEDEIQFHVASRIEELSRDGLSLQEAEGEARRHFGNLLLLRESSRDVKLILWLDVLMQDFWYGLRLLNRGRGITLVAVVTLALGIGANTAIFSIVDAVLIRSLPYRDTDRLVMLWGRTFPKTFARS